MRGRNICLTLMAALALAACDPAEQRSSMKSRPPTTGTPADQAAATSTTTTTPPQPTQTNVGTPDFLDANLGFAPVGVSCDTPPCRFDIAATSDGGLNWARRSLEPVTMPATSVLGVPKPVVHFATPSIGWLYAVPDSRDSHGGQFWRTTDGGRTWVETATAEPTVALVAHGRSVWRVERSCPAESTKDCQITVFMSGDSGAHWSALAAQPPITGDLEGFTAPGPAVAYVLSGRDAPDTDKPSLPTLSRTTDGGHSWKEIRPPCAGHRGEDLATSTPFDLWFVCHDQPGSGAMAPKHLYRSRDGGAHWSADLGTPNIGAGGRTASGSPSRACRGGSRTGISCTRDGGRHWFFPNAGGPENPRDGGIHVIEFADPRHAWALGQDGESGSFDVLWRTTDGGESWSPSVLRTQPRG
jgi:photosystem II stability/assembly factor-like uncharacterized protein